MIAVSRRAFLTLLGALGVSKPVFAQSSYPNRPIRIVIGFAAGGGTDLVARAFAPKLSELLEQSVIVDNRPGANGNVGTEHVAKAPADGYTLLMAVDGTMSVNPAIEGNVPFNVTKDFAPILKVAAVPLVLVAHPSFPASNVQEFLIYAKRNPDLGFATSGHASVPHLTMLLLGQRTGTQFTHVAYKGTGQAVSDVLAGHVPLMMAAIAGVKQHVRAGKLKVIAITSNRRHASLPEVPTFSESGVPGFDVSGWCGLLAPSGTPKAIVDRLYKDSLTVLALPETKARFMNEFGVDIADSSPEKFAGDIQGDLAKWGALIKSANLKVTE